MKTICSVFFALAICSLSLQGEELARYSGHLIKYDRPAGTPKAMFCLRHPQSHLSALWLVGVDLSKVEKDSVVLVEGVIHTKYIPVESASSSKPPIWEVWMDVKRFKVIKDKSVDLNAPLTE